MKALVTATHHFYLDAENRAWTSNASFGYPFWQRYLDVFDEITVLARAKRVNRISDDVILASGDNVSILSLPEYVGTSGYLRNYFKIRQVIKGALAADSAVVLRLASVIGTQVWRMMPGSRPYGVEVVGDPYDVFTPGLMRHPLRPFLRWYFPRILRKQCKQAAAASYVTETSLQKRYPPGADTYSTYYSSVIVTKDQFVQQARRWDSTSHTFRLIMVGPLRQLYKAPDVLLEAFGRLVSRGKELELVYVGGGQFLEMLQRRANELGVENRVRFTGQLSQREEILAELDAADLFVLPSHQEGLPRAMIEAMARALPCIGTPVGGIPELISHDALVTPGNIDELAEKIDEVLSDPQRITKMSTNNLEKARTYEQSVLRERRQQFYQYLHDRTEPWLNTKEARM